MVGVWPPHGDLAGTRCRSSAVGTIGAVQDYAGAWTAERGRCHRFVYVDGDGRPANCPEPTVTSGWRRCGQGRWYVLDACARHAPQLLARPLGGYRVSFNRIRGRQADGFVPTRI